MVVIAALARGAGPVTGESTDTAAPSLPSPVHDLLILAVLTVGVALVVAVFIVQFGGGGGDRTSTRRRLLGTVLAAVVCVLLIELLPRNDEPLEVEPTETRSAVSPDEDPGGGTPAGPSGWAVAILGGAVLITTAAWLWAGRRDGPRGGPVSGEGTTAERRDLVAGILDDAIDQLRHDPDRRRAVIATWSRLEAALELAGLPRRPSEAPFPYLGRILAAVETSGPAARRLTEAFERAMFSSHEIDEGRRQDAVDALVAVRDELQVGRPA